MPHHENILRDISAEKMLVIVHNDSIPSDIYCFSVTLDSKSYC